LLTTGFYSLETEIKNLSIHENRKTCNVCGWRGKSFHAFFNEMCRQKDESLCPRCHSSVYQRALVKYLQENCKLDYRYEVMEIGPHKSNPVGAVLKSMVYTSIDIVKGRAEYQMDLTDLRFANDSFDVIVCSAVLEHIKDDVKAISEMYRVLKKGGSAIIEIPIGYYADMQGKHTTEFVGQPFYEHYRAYGRDFIDKMDKAGFDTTNIHYKDLESPSLLGFYVGTKL